MNASFPSILLDEAVENSPHDLLSKADFVHAVETLAGDLSKHAIAASGIDDMESVYSTCPYDTWKQTFGRVRDIQEHHSVQTWEQPCSDGVVHCIGYFVDDPDDRKWVIVTRICLF
ncbi:MAG: hypothetical protein WCJ35_23130 [Planctomycetota bacterium]